MVRIPALLALLLVALVVPANAQAQACVAPPGTAAVEEYCEFVPNADGERPATQRGIQPALPIPASTRRALQRTEAGRELERVLQTPPGGSDDAPGRQRAGDDADPVDAPSNNPLSAVSAAVSSGPGATVLMPSALLGITILLGAWAWIGLRRRTLG